jgi:hypothetical protein
MPVLNDTTERYDMTAGQYLFDSLDEVRDCATRRLWIYNNERPIISLLRAFLVNSAETNGLKNK